MLFPQLIQINMNHVHIPWAFMYENIASNTHTEKSANICQ